MKQAAERPPSEAMKMEDIVTASLLTNETALLRYGANFCEEMFISKKNWHFINESLDLNSGNRLDAMNLLHVLEEKNLVKNPRQEYEKLIKGLNSNHHFERVYPFWLDMARKRFVTIRESEMPIGSTNFNDLARNRMDIYHEAACLGGMDIGVPIERAIRDFSSDLLARRASGGADLLTTGYPRLDEEVILDPGQMVVIPARPAIGKTSLALELSLYNQGRGPVLINSLEMTFNQLIRKLLESKSVLPGYMIKKPWGMDDTHLVRLDAGLKKLAQTNLHLAGTFDLVQLEAAILQLRPVLVVVDYIQMYAQPMSFKGTRADWITHVSREFARMSRRHGTIMLVLSQLNRKGVDDPDSHNIKDAGGVEENADSIWILSRPHSQEKNRLSLKTILRVTKNRSGAGYFEEELMFDEETQKFLLWDEVEAEKLWLRHVERMSRLAAKR